MLAIFREMLVNLAASAVSEVSSPAGMLGYLLGIGFVVYGVIVWHRKRVAQGKRGVDSGYFISLALVIAVIAFGAGAYGIGLRSGNPAVASPAHDSDTHLTLKFGGPNSIPVATDVANIWRWYALANNLFLTFGRPIDVKQVLIEGENLPPHEIKDRDARSVVIAFRGDIQNALVKVRMDTSVGAVPQPIPTTAPVETMQPLSASSPAPIKPSKNYFPDEKKDLGNLYASILNRLNKDGMAAAKQAYNFGGDTPADNLNQLTAHLARVTEARKLASDLSKYVYNDLLPNNPTYSFELTQLFSNSVDNVPLGTFKRELDKYHRAISLFVDRYEGLPAEDRVITADLIKQTTPRLLETSQLFQNWIRQCNERIDAQRELLR